MLHTISINQVKPAARKPKTTDNLEQSEYRTNKRRLNLKPRSKPV
jgi:hypothetical protein